MTRGQLPKAYLRLDPNIDQTHPDNLGDFIRLLCAANRQPTRGQFRSRGVLESLFGKTGTHRLYDRRDVMEDDAGIVTVPGWEGWQEGDLTVSERMTRMRNQRNNTVTAPSPDRITPSEATRRLGNKASSSSDEEGRAAKPRPPSDRQRAFAWFVEHGARRPTGYPGDDLADLVGAYGADRVIATLDALTGPMTSKAYIRAAQNALEPNVKASANGTGSAPKGHHGDPEAIANAFRS